MITTPPPAYAYTWPGHLTVTNAPRLEVRVRVEDLCWPNCDHSTTAPMLNAADFSCFLQAFAAHDPWANCDSSTTAPVLNVADFTCFLGAIARPCPSDRVSAGTATAPLPAPVVVLRGSAVAGWYGEGRGGRVYRVEIWPDALGVIEIDTGRTYATATGHGVLWQETGPATTWYNVSFTLPAFSSPALQR